MMLIGLRYRVCSDATIKTPRHFDNAKELDGVKGGAEARFSTTLGGGD